MEPFSRSWVQSPRKLFLSNATIMLWTLLLWVASFEAPAFLCWLLSPYAISLNASHLFLLKLNPLYSESHLHILHFPSYWTDCSHPRRPRWPWKITASYVLFLVGWSLGSKESLGNSSGSGDLTVVATLSNSQTPSHCGAKEAKYTEWVSDCLPYCPE